MKTLPIKCPVCDGRGKVPRGFYDVYPFGTTTDASPETCRTCNGATIIYPDASQLREPSTEQSGGTTQEELWNELNRKFPDQDSIIYDLMHNWIITRKQSGGTEQEEIPNDLWLDYGRDEMAYSFEAAEKRIPNPVDYVRKKMSEKYRITRKP